jgi:hypothetical protein
MKLLTLSYGHDDGGKDEDEVMMKLILLILLNINQNMTKRSFSDTNDEILYLKNKIKELEEKLARSEPKPIKNPIQQNNFAHNSLESCI